MKTFAMAALLGWSSWAYAGTITAELDRTEGSIDETFKLVVNLEGSWDDFQAPEPQGAVLRQQGRSESTVFSNGKRTNSMTLTFGVYPQQEGQVTIPSFTATIDGKKESTLPLTIKVLPASGGKPSAQAPQQGQQGQPQPGQRPGQPRPGTQGQAQGRGQPTKGGKEDTGGVFIERECQNASPYVNQQVVCLIRVYHRGNLNGGQRLGSSSPDFRRFNVEGERRYQKIVNGQRYGVIELREIIVPSKAGTLEIAPYQLQARVLVMNRKNNPLDKFFDNFGGGVFNFDLNFSEEREVTVKSEPTALEVQAWPEAGKLPNFNGLVGSFRLNASANKQKLATGDTVTITISITGEGVLDNIADLKPDLDKLGKVYADKPEYSEEVDGDRGIRSTKTFKYALVPTQPGTHALGQLNIAAFDPKTGQYQALQADLGTLIVEPGKAEEKPLVVGGQPSNGNDKTDVKVLAQDLIGPHAVQLLSHQQTITGSDAVVLASLSGFPLLAGFGLLGLQSAKTRRSKFAPQARRSKALKAFKEQLNEAQKAVERGNPSEGLVAVHRAVRGYIGDKANLHSAALTQSDIAKYLEKSGTSPETRTRLAQILGRLEQAEFGGYTPDAAQAKEWTRELDHIVSELDKQC